MNELSYEGSIPHIILPRLAWLYMHFLGLTSKIRIKGENRHEGAAMYALWHRQEVLLIYLHRGMNLCSLVSKSKDGEYMARILRLFGFSFVRGSTTSGGPLSLRGLLRAARDGMSIAITPDGPKGPIFKVQPGLLFLAQKSGAPVIPAACAMTKKLILRSWDKYQFPLPFGRIQVVYGKPFPIAETDDLAVKAVELETILNNLTAEAEALLTDTK